MAQRKYVRDVWALGPNQTGYPGGFPKGLVSAIKKRWWGQKRLWVFSGGFKDSGGTTVDIKPECHPDFVANAEQLPFEDNSFDFVMMDPPYSEQEAQELYGLHHPSMVKILNEMARVTAPGGTCILLHRLIPSVHPQFNNHWKRLYLKAVIGVFTIAGMTNMRSLTVWGKQASL